MTVAPPLKSPLNQVALSVIDLKRSEQWFREGLGFVLAGGSRLMMSGPLAAPVQGLPGAASTCCWLVGRNPWFQLELFQFCRPVAQLMPDAAHEALWGLAGARTRSAVFERGDVPVEAVQYLDPPGRPWAPGYRISDQGILNIAFGARSRQEHRQLFDRALTLGARPNHRPIDLPGVGVVYVNDAQGFSVELLRMAPWADKHWGFVPRPLQQRPQPDNQRVEASVPIDAVWAVLNEQGRMGDWIGFPQVSVQREGFAQRNGRGSERFMKEPLGTVREQVTGVEAKSRIRYRVIDGSPVVYRQGEIDVAASGRGTRATWSIRFRCKVPLFGGLLPATLRRVLANMLVKGLKAHVEGAGRPALQTA
jgi:catechol 2,3-dioxygenase-like lactoylglutathione lyase family enzyme